MQKVKQLLEQFSPSKYNLSLTIDRKTRATRGIISIHGKSNSAGIIELHSKDLTINSVTIDGKNSDFKHSANDVLTLISANLLPGKHIVVIDFIGKITDAMHGIYPCYFEHQGAKKELIATQFESHHAREAFPCVDEPAAKATFDVTLTTENEVTVLGNMPVKNQKIENNMLVTTFETTPIMSSYLLAWVVGDLHCKSAKTKSGVEVNVWSTVAQPKDNLDFALDIAVRSIDFYEEYFDVSYPLPKSDQVALPDFASGAMENWGLVTYREIALLVDSKTTSIFNKHYVALVIAHELSHQWFGNLVTMKWWNDLWLNESFATVMEYIAIDAIEPSWEVWMDFDNHEGVSALQRDSLDGVQSVQTDVNHPDEISTLFDGAIVYAKGAKLLRMLRKYVGEDSFKLGLKNYFNKYKYKNTEAVNLWDELSSVSGKDTAKLMSSWIAQPGFPVIHVSLDGAKLKLSQERLTTGSTSYDTLWPIPINANHAELPEIFDKKTLEVQYERGENLRLNIGNTGHFITHYSHDLLMTIIDDIKNRKLSAIDRLQILNEQTILARSGIASSAELIPLLNVFKEEEAEPVWSIISLAINELKCFVENDDQAEKILKSYTTSLARYQFERLGWQAKPQESTSDTKLRLYIAGMMAYGESPEIIKEATHIYNSAPFEDLVPEIRSLELSIFIRNSSDKALVESLLNKYKNTNSAGLRQDITSGLTSARNTDIIELLLNKIKDTSTIRTQDSFRWILYLLLNKYSRTQTWQWLRDNWAWITTTFSGDKSYDDFTRFAAMALSTQEQLSEYRTFFEKYRSDPALTRSIDMGVVEIENRIARIERDKTLVNKTLSNL
jgi:aminopeptidase N